MFLHWLIILSIIAPYAIYRSAIPMNYTVSCRDIIIFTQNLIHDVLVVELLSNVLKFHVNAPC